MRLLLMPFLLSLGLVPLWIGPSAAQSDRRDPESLPRATALLQSSLPWDFGPYYQAIGDRLHRKETARITLVGSLQDSRGTGAIRIEWQLPGYGRIDDLRPGGRSIRYDGTAVTTTSGAPASADVPLVETLISDLPENVFTQLSEGGAYRRILHWARTDPPGAQDSGQRVDVFEVNPASDVATKAAAPLPHKLVVFDSRTRLLHSVRYLRSVGGASVVVETRYRSWSPERNPYPAEISRHENGREILKLTVAAFTSSPRGPVADFRP